MRSFLGAWLVSLRRTRADWPIVATAALIALLAATLLAAGPIYSAAVAQAGLHRLIESAPIADANIEVSVRTSPDQAKAGIDTVDGLLRQAVAQPDLDIVTGAESDTFAVPGQDPARIHDLLKLGSLEGIEDHATLVAGTWPRTAATDAPLQVAVLQPIATTLGLHVGGTLSLVSRVDPNTTVNATVSAIYVPTDPEAPYWWDDPALTLGVVESPNYRTFGPVLAPLDDLLGRVGGTSVHLSWHAFPAVDQLRIADIAGLRARTELLPIQVTNALPSAYPTTKTGLPALLATSERSLLVSRTGVLLLLVQLGVLAGYAIALTADLIVDHRRIDTALLRSRGASTRQVAVLALAESLLLAVPGVILGPWLAAVAVRAFNVAGPLTGIGLTIEPVVSPDAYVAAAAASIACALLVVVPAVSAARSFAAERADTRRPGTRTLGQRVGLDIALLAVTVVALWQLRLYGTPLTQTVRGALGLDPLLIAAPAIGILAGSVVALRFVPLLAHAADSLTARGRDLVGSLGARQLARRPLRYTRTALLIMLAIAMGVFSVSYASTWVGSQRDQADYQVGADARVTPRRAVGGIPEWAEGRAVAAVPGISAAMSVARDTARFTRSSGTGQIIALDAAAATSVLGSTVGSGDVQAAATALLEARPAAAGLPLPATPRRLLLTVSADVQSVTYDFDPQTGDQTEHHISPATDPSYAIGATVTVRDEAGLFRRFTGASTRLVDGSQALLVPLVDGSPAAQALTDRFAGGLDWPIEIAAIDLNVSTPGFSQTFGRFVIERVATSDTMDGQDWVATQPGGAGAWSTWASDSAGFGGPPVSIEDDLAGAALGRLVLVIQDFWSNSGTSAQPISIVRTDIARRADGELPVVGNRAFLAAVAAAPGQSVIVQASNSTRRLHIVGAVDAFPTTDPSQPVAIVDMASLSLLRFARDHAYQGVEEWWLDLADPAVTPPATGVLDGATIVSRIDTRERLTTEPLAVAMIGGLSLGFVVAAMFAVIGLAVSAAVSARQRRTEFALLRALGLSPGQLSGWLWLENASVVVVAVLAGTGLGLAIGWVVLPFVTVSATGGAPFPPVIVDVPWPSVAVLTAVTAGALIITLLLIARSIRRAGIGSVLRMGED